MPLLLLLALLPFAAWAIGQGLGDRFRWSQFLAWIPTPLVACWLWTFAVAMVVAALWSWGRRRGGAAVALTAFLALALTVQWVLVENRPFAERRVQSAKQPLTILHCNLHWPGRSKAPAMLEITLGRTEDILVFTDPGWLLHHGREATLRDEGWDVLRIGRYAVISRLPLLEHRVLIAGGGSDVTMIQVDAASRGLGVLTLGLVDLPSRLKHPRMEWARQVRALLDERGAPSFDLVLGDFNTTRGSPSLEVLFPGMRHAWVDAGRGWSGTYPREVPLWHIDHVLLGPDLRAVDYHMVDLGVSGHRAQVVEVVGAATTIEQP